MTRVGAFLLNRREPGRTCRETQPKIHRFGSAARSSRRIGYRENHIVAASNYLFTSESVSEGHPDKVCDRISDAVVDAFLTADPEARVACETLTTTNRIVLAGEVRGPAPLVDGSGNIDKARVEEMRANPFEERRGEKTDQRGDGEVLPSPLSTILDGDGEVEEEEEEKLRAAGNPVLLLALPSPPRHDFPPSSIMAKKIALLKANTVKH